MKDKKAKELETAIKQKDKVIVDLRRELAAEKLKSGGKKAKEDIKRLLRRIQSLRSAVETQRRTIQRLEDSLGCAY